MKKNKVLLSTFAVLAIVAGTMAFKINNYFGSGSVYCTSTCPVVSKVDFRIDPTGFNTIPCGAGVQPYVWSICGGKNTCVATPVGTTFISTAAGN